MDDLSNEASPYILRQIEAKSRSAVIKIRLLSYRSIYPRGNIIVVEGDDDKVVYSHWIHATAPNLRFEFFVCGGKRAARQLNGSLSEDRAEAGRDVYYIVDRDFDDLTGFKDHSTVFMLDRYSFENFLVSGCVLDRALKAAFPSNGTPARRKIICDLFEADYQTFLGYSKELNGRLYLMRRLDKRIVDPLPSTLSGIVKICLGRVEPAEADLKGILPIPDDLNEGMVQELDREFELLNPAERYRGKFAMKFFRVWLDCLVKEHRDGLLGLFEAVGDGQSKIKHDEMSLGSLAAMTSPPNGLPDFLELVERTLTQTPVAIQG